MSTLSPQLRAVFDSLFERHAGAPLESVTPLRAHASDRKIYRLEGGGERVIAVRHAVLEENRAFIEFSRHFLGHGLPVPRVFVEDQAAGVYLQQDLGDTTLYDAVLAAGNARGIFPESIEALYHDALEYLPRFQVEAGRSLDFSLCYPRAAYDRTSMLWDMRYFRDSFLRRVGIFFDDLKLERDFEALADFLVTAPSDYFVYRDFQSRNIMVKDGGLFFIDYQSGRKGALHYDLATLIYQSSVTIPSEARTRLVEGYLQALAQFVPVDRAQFKRFLAGFVYVQLMHRFGTYGRHGLELGKQYFIDSIPRALAKLPEMLGAHPFPVSLPELSRLFELLAASPERVVDNRAAGPAQVGLTVDIVSFSYRQGLPNTRFSNGGGFVFDCRGILNPGRDPAFKSKSGLDMEVRNFLEGREDTERFFVNVSSIVEASVKNYLERQFTELSVAFGCTGGQHRSVYFAERLQRFLQERFPIKVTLSHRELGRLGLEKR